MDIRVLTDIRPIFTDDSNVKINGQIILHNLKISYQEGDDIKEIFFAIDNNDIKKIKEQAERAEKKENEIKKFIGTTQYPIFEQ